MRIALLPIVAGAHSLPKQASAVWRGTGQQKPPLYLDWNMVMAYIDYESLVEEALLEVVKKALKIAADKGLDDPHHFYITLASQHPGLELPNYLKKEYPEEITIVLQYEFWDLKVEKDYFSVTLSFEDSTETIKAPFSSVLNFTDPSQNFSLEFQPKFPEKKAPPPTKSKGGGDNIISLDRFRKK